MLAVVVPVQQPAAGSLGEYMSEVPPTSLLTPVSLLDVWQGFAVTHVFGSYKRMTTQFIWSTGTWESTEIVGVDQNFGTSSSTNR